MPPGRRVDDDCLIPTGTLDLANAVAESLEPTPGLGRADVDEKMRAFGVGHLDSHGHHVRLLALSSRELVQQVEWVMPLANHHSVDGPLSTTENESFAAFPKRLTYLGFIHPLLVWRPESRIL